MKSLLRGRLIRLVLLMNCSLLATWCAWNSLPDISDGRFEPSRRGVSHTGSYVPVTATNRFNNAYPSQYIHIGILSGIHYPTMTNGAHLFDT